MKPDEDSPGHSPPPSPSGFPGDDPGGVASDGLQFRRRAHTFSHPPVKKRISFEGQPAKGQATAPRSVASNPSAPECCRTEYWWGVRAIQRHSVTYTVPFASSWVSMKPDEDSPGHSPPPSPSGFPGDDPGGAESDGLQFRRRAHTFSHPPVKKRISFEGQPANQGKQQQHPIPLRRQQSFRSCRTGNNWAGAYLTSTPPPPPTPRHALTSPAGVSRTRSVSESESSSSFSLPSSFSAPTFLKSFYQGSLGSLADSGTLKSNGEGRKRTLSACSSDSIFLRVASPMNKTPATMENSASRNELHIRKVKLDYQEVVPPSAEHRLQQRLAPARQHDPPDTPYQDLLKQLTAQQHAILVDLAQLGAGQLSLYNLLKAYSLLDTEVGYCQGVSFVAGILLLHMSEEQAFDMLKFLDFLEGRPPSSPPVTCTGGLHLDLQTAKLSSSCSQRVPSQRCV
ncbi:LOW QUALITY PROTEIN: hypothetical protein CRUP_000191 [Coryphaenoides rupestris]|nr:LOW QUALITY PROTEIN: hypothetical protein CRUP_000191 [Coryphaenoides rupestris]